MEDKDYVTQKPQMQGNEKERMNGRSWGQNNINFRTSDDEQIIEW